MTNRETVGVVCGSCLKHTSVAHLPDACWSGCGARFDRAPYALLTMTIETGPVQRGVVAVEPRFAVEFVGPWDIESRAAIVTAFGG